MGLGVAAGGVAAVVGVEAVALTAATQSDKSNSSNNTGITSKMSTKTEAQAARPCAAAHTEPFLSRLRHCLDSDSKVSSHSVRLCCLIVGLRQFNLNTLKCAAVCQSRRRNFQLKITSSLI